MMIFAYPWMLLLLALPLLLRLVLPPYRVSRAAVSVPFMRRLAKLTGQQPASGSAVARRSPWQWLVVLLTWALIVLGLARPQWLEDPLSKTIPTRDLLLAVDLSGSMETTDFTNDKGEQVDRLTAVKQVLDEFLVKRKGDRMGLIFFGSAPFVQVPFTEDLAVCRTLLNEAQVRMAGPQTAMGDAIGLAMNVFEHSETRERVLIVLTDGNDTSSAVPPEQAAAIARDRKIKIYTIAIGDPQAIGEEKLDEDTLRKVATTTGGRFYQGNDRQELLDIYGQLDELETHQVETITHRPKRDLFHWFLGAVLLVGTLHQGLELIFKRS